MDSTPESGLKPGWKNQSIALQDVVARLERLPFSSFQLFIVLAAGFSAFFDYYDFSTMSFTIAPVQQEFGLSPFSVSLLLSTTFIGAFFGGIIAGRLADLFGRRRWFLITLIMVALGSLLTGLSTNYYEMIVSRFITGFGVTGDYAIVEAYISELLPSKTRAKAMGIIVGVASSAFLFTALLGAYLLKTLPLSGWRYVFFIGSAIAIAVWFVRRLVPESPRFYIEKGMQVEAENALKEIEQRTQRSIGRELPQPIPLGLAQIVGGSGIRELLGSKYRLRTIHSALAYVFDSMGFYGFITFLPLILVTRGFTIVNSLSYIAVADVGTIIGGFGLFFVGDRLQRKDIMALSGITIAASTLILAYAVSPIFVMLFGFISSFFDQLSYGALSIYLGEIFPTRLRTSGAGLTNALARLVSVAGIFYLGVALAGKPSLQLVFIASSWLVFSAIIGLGGVRVNRRVLEEVSP
ncbi:MAG: MFS transporter [Thermoprotei archaeon]